jgi:hypothetical protein
MSVPTNTVKLSSLINDLTGLLESLQAELTAGIPIKAETGSWLNPRIELIGTHLHVNKLVIPLRSRPKTLKLIEAFIQHKDGALSRQDLIQHVYGTQVDSGDLSPRLTFSLYQNALKLISRSRSLLNEAMSQQGRTPWIDWFVYDDSCRRWHFYKLRSPFGE